MPVPIIAVTNASTCLTDAQVEAAETRDFGIVTEQADAR